MNYVQLQFDPPPTINALTPITVRCGGRSAATGDEPFRNLICEQIPKTVASVSILDSEALTFSFEDDSTIAISLREEDYVGPEAVNIFGTDNFWVVFAALLVCAGVIE